MRLGIVGNGMIVRKLFGDTRQIAELEMNALCVRPQSVEKGNALASEFGVPVVYTDYGKFLEEANIDTVYIGITNHQHFCYAKQALEAGKHVICEKPFTVTAKEAEILAETARSQGLFLWEAFKIPYSPVFQAVREHLPEIGAVKMVQCNYSRISSRYSQYETGVVLPAFDPSCAGGSLYDINVYNLHFVTGLFGKPKQVHYYANKGFNGIDTSGTAILEYDGFHAVCSGAKDSSSPCFSVLQGTKGFIRVNGPASSADQAELTVNGETRVLVQDSLKGSLANEMRKFARQLKDGDRKTCLEMLDHSVMMMEVMEEAYRGIL